MGEAKKRKDQEARLRADVLDGLSDTVTTVANTAITMFERFVLPRRYVGGCYLTTMFLRRFLWEERGILTQPIIGYVNDGTDEIFMSHAWLEFEGRKTDLMLYAFDQMISAPTGNVLVLDRLLRQGEVQHTYHLERTEAGEAMNAILLASSDFAHIARHKEREHSHMLGIINDPEAVAAHMTKAPLGLRYEDMLRAVA